jgi:tetratricopeptide (TPR) repeat protein
MSDVEHTPFATGCFRGSLLFLAGQDRWRWYHKRLLGQCYDSPLIELYIMQAMNRPQEAITSYLQAIRLRPDFAIAHGNLASIYYEQGQLEQAIATYRDAILLEPTFVEAYNNLVSPRANLV